MKDEQRKFTRVVVKKDEIQVFSDDAMLFGQLNDISIDGLSFRYTPITGEKLDTNSINILPKGTDQFNLYHIACRIIYDISFLEEGQISKGNKSNQCGIKFFGLKKNKTNKLELLMKNYTAK